MQFEAKMYRSTPAVDVVDKWLEHARYTALWCVQGHIKMPFFRQASFRSEYDSRIYHLYVHKCSLIYHLVPFQFLQIVQILRITIHSIEILFADYALSTWQTGRRYDILIVDYMSNSVKGCRRVKMTAHPSQKALFCDRIYDFSSHTVQLAVWLLVFYGSVIPILWVSVSYITLLSRRNQ